MPAVYFSLRIRKKYAEALQICDEEVVLAPNDVDLRRKRGGIYSMLRRMDEAVEEENYILNNLEYNVGDYFIRGGYYLRDEANYAALDDFTFVVNAQDDPKRDYFIETTHFFSAIACIQLGKWDAAKEHCRNVSDDHFMWIIGLPLSVPVLLEHIEQRKMLK